jgi:biopolymer transport protein TolR
MAEINVVPYIDVMLVLLIIFMVTAPMLTQGVKVDLPNAPAEPIGKVDDEPLIVSIKADGSLYLNLGKDPKKAMTIEAISDRVSKVMRAKSNTPVLVWGDANVPYGQVVTLMTQLQAAGAPSVGLVTEDEK